MIEHVFSSEMMKEREKQLALALLDCAVVYYDINFTQNKILGDPIQIVDGKEYHILDLIGKPKGCSHTEIVEYWAGIIPESEAAGFVEFSDIDRIKACYAAGERLLRHKFWTSDVLGNPILAEQSVRLYEDLTSGDLLGLVYVSNRGELDIAKQKEEALQKQYVEASGRIAAFQNASANLPGGYHRCSADDGYPFLFVSKSFEQIVGYTARQLIDELDNKFVNLIVPEDLHRFARLELSLEEAGHGEVAYRIRRRDGEIRWVQDSTLFIEWEGTPCYQCTITDITDFVRQQERYARQAAEYEDLAENMPCGYHRCTTEDGFRLEFVSDSFVDTVGYSREELIGMQYIDIVAPEDRDFFMSNEPALVRDGKIDLAYRIKRKDGSYRWIQDSTVRIINDGHAIYQCTLADITEFVRRQDEMAKQNMEIMRQKTMYDVMESNMPGGYHRCRADKGCPFTYIGGHFTDIVGFTKEEIERDFGNLYENLIWHEDLGTISTYEQMLEMRGKGNSYDTSVYRIKHKDGGYRWVTDSTMFVDMGEDSFFQAIISDITEYIEDLNIARKQAEASNQAKSTFLFNASHDIRTPMNAIKGFARIIEQNASDPELVIKTVQKIQQAGDTLMTLMNDILDLARIERGKEELNMDRVCLSDHGRNLYEMFEESMKNDDIDFSTDINIEHEHVFCDKLKLTRICMNMLSNAKKFTPSGGRVVFGVRELSCDGRSASYRIYSKDSGIGMSKDFQARAFEEFERERTSSESGISGSGLGLAIIKKLVEIMGGEIYIESDVGKGTEIGAILSFPLIDKKDTQSDGSGALRMDLRGYRVLLVEDNDFNREIARYLLKEMELDVDDAQNGLECINMLSKAAEGYYDLVLMDIQMPVMNGYKATAAIRNMAGGIANIPIVAMTANAFDEDKQKCYEVGMNGHIGKPLESENVFSELARVLSR